MERYLLTSANNKMGYGTIVENDGSIEDSNTIRIGFYHYVNINKSEKIPFSKFIDFFQKNHIEYEKKLYSLNFNIPYWYGENRLVAFSLPLIDDMVLNNEDLHFEQSFNDFLSLVKALHLKF